MVFMASLLVRQGQHSQALEWARKALDQDPDNAEAVKLITRLEARAAS